MKYHQLFIHSDLGTQDSSIGPSNEQDIIRRIVIDQNIGSVIHDLHANPFDYINLPKGDLRRMTFRITDYNNNLVDMLNMDISFSILIISENEFT